MVSKLPIYFSHFILICRLLSAEAADSLIPDDSAAWVCTRLYFSRMVNSIWQANSAGVL